MQRASANWQWSVVRTITAESNGRITECVVLGQGTSFFRVIVTDRNPYSDADGDGLPYAAEIKLGTNPSVSDNSLTLTSIPSQVKGIVNVNLNIASQVPSTTSFSLLVDGETTGDADIFKDGNQWKLRWDTSNTPNGWRSLRLQTQYPGLHGTYGYALGATRRVNINNLFTFDRLTRQFDEYFNLSFIVNNHNPLMDILVDFYDEDDDYIDSWVVRPSFVLGNFQIDIKVDTLAANSPFPVDEPIRAEFFRVGRLRQFPALPYANSIRKFAGQVGDVSGPQDHDNTGDPVQTQTYAKEVSWTGDDFVVAWGWDKSAWLWGKIWGQDFAHKHSMIQNGVLNIIANPALTNPYRVLPSQNGFGRSTTFMLTPNNKTNLLNTLAQPNSRNFFWFGHGNNLVISNGKTDDEGVELEGYVSLNFSEVANALGNASVASFTRNGQLSQIGTANHPYRLVILMGCNTDGANWCDAFGIAKETSNVATYQSLGLKPRAIVVWKDEISVPRGAHASNVLGREFLTHRKMSNAMAVFFSNWMANRPLNQCMHAFVRQALSGSTLGVDHFLGMESWQIYGCADLRRSDNQ